MCHCGECSGGLFWKSGPDAGSWHRSQRHHRWNSTACGAAEKVDSRTTRSCCRQARCLLMAFNFKQKKMFGFPLQRLSEPRAIRRGSSWLSQRKSWLTQSHTLSCLNLVVVCVGREGCEWRVVANAWKSRRLPWQPSSRSVFALSGRSNSGRREADKESKMFLNGVSPHLVSERLLTFLCLKWHGKQVLYIY